MKPEDVFDGITIKDIFDNGYDPVLRDLPNVEAFRDYMCHCAYMLDTDKARAMQVVYPDRNHRMPWHAEFDMDSDQNIIRRWTPEDAPKLT